MELEQTTPQGTGVQTSEQSQQTQQSQESPQSAQRREVYAKYYGGQPKEESVSSEQSTEETAQVSQSQTQETQSTQETPPPDERDQRLARVEEAIGQLTNFLSQITQQQQAPPPAPQPTQQESAPSSWIELLREGKITEAEEALAATIAKKFVPQTKSEATSEALDLFRIETELTGFVNDLRRENPDLLPLEDTIAAKAQARIEALQRSGKIRNAEDYIRAYKTSVDESVADARKIIQTIRAAGKEEAIKRTQEVLSSSTVAPNAVSPAPRGEIVKKEEKKFETTEDYLARRRAAVNRSAGLVA